MQGLVPIWGRGSPANCNARLGSRCGQRLAGILGHVWGRGYVSPIICSTGVRSRCGEGWARILGDKVGILRGGDFTWFLRG